MVGVPRSLTADDRLWSQVDQNGPLHAALGTPCWIWLGMVNNAGYGTIRIGAGRRVLVHRFAYQLLRSEPVGNLDHRCRIRRCVNPAHLRFATVKQNGENLGVARNNTSGVRGVSWDSSRYQWKAQVRHHGRPYHAGRFNTKEEASEAVRLKRIELFTHNDEDREVA